MNVKIVNKYATLLVNLDVDFIKSIQGEFTPEDIIMQFSNFFYNKMIIDITAIKGYQDITKIQELSVNMDMSKVILLLDDSEVVNSPRYLSQLVSMGIYNVTRNIDAIQFLIDNPNTYKDVAQYHQLNMLDEDESDSSSSSEKERIKEKEKKKKKEEVKDESFQISSNEARNVRVIGIKNVTEHAGSTTLTYLLKKQLEKAYKVLAIEVDGEDFVYFNDKSLKKVNHAELQDMITSHYDVDVILVDLNEQGSKNLCTEVLYLIEPGLIKLNKLIRKNPRAFENLKGEKILLNRSVLNETDVSDFEYESRSKIYYNIPYLDDKLDNNKVLNDLLIKLGFSKLDVDDSAKGGSLFNIFK
ncbi:MAG: hypothetical protein IJ704_03275 [Bacilli bacterium]|nr:hypothetical protein [Bacilli bacterium]